MKIKEKIFTVTVVVAIVAILGYVFYKMYKQKDSKDNSEQKPCEIKTGAVQNTTKWTPDAFPLQKGMQGNIVRHLQTMLNQRYDARLVVDGKFGEKTFEAVQKIGVNMPISTSDYIFLTGGTFKK